jgi:hypothetical protein
MKEELKKLADEWWSEAVAWREAGKIAKASEPAVSARNYARAHALEACRDSLQLIIDRYEKP